MPVASRWARSLRRPTAAMTGYWPRPWTPWTPWPARPPAGPAGGAPRRRPDYQTRRTGRHQRAWPGRSPLGACRHPGGPPLAGAAPHAWGSQDGKLRWCWDGDAADLGDSAGGKPRPDRRTDQVMVDVDQRRDGHWPLASLVAAVVGAAEVVGLLAGCGHHELAHHSLVLMEDEVAVEHGRAPGVGVGGEPHDEPDRDPRRQVHGVLPAGQLRRRGRPAHVEQLELHPVDVEVVRHEVLVAHLPDLGGVLAHHLSIRSMSMLLSLICPP